MIKEHFLVFAAIAAIFTVSCASTPASSKQKEESVQNLEEKPEDSDSILKNDDNKNSETENNPQNDFQATEENVKSSENEFEKVAEEDLPFEKQSENAPLEAESKIFAEPDVIDISEEPEVIEENQANSENESENQNPQNEEPEIEKPGEISENSAESAQAAAQAANANENKNSDETNATITEEASETIQDSNGTGNENNGTETATKEDLEAENQKSGENEDLPSSGKQADEEKPWQNSDSEKIVPSRKVTIKRNQDLCVVYPGNGWIYIGEEKTPSLLTYFGRITDSSKTTFTLRSGNAGETFLHFYKNDALTGKTIDDYLLVTVEDKIASPEEKTLAPSYAEIVPPHFQKRQNGISIKNEKTDIKNDEFENTSGFGKSQNLKDNKENAQESENLENGKSGEKSYVQNPRENRENQNFSSNDVKTLVSTPEKQNQQKNAASSVSGNFYQNQKNDSKKSNPKDENSSLSNGNETQQNFVLEPEVQTADEENESGEELLEKAKSLFGEKKYAQSLESCLDFINGSNENLDEAYYLLGQIYEAESPVKNIRNALDSYNTVTKNFPLSKLWQKAKERSVYLKRFYIDIR